MIFSEQSLELFNLTEALHYCQIILFINVFWLVQGLGEEVDSRRQITPTFQLDELATTTLTIILPHSRTFIDARSVRTKAWLDELATTAFVVILPHF